MIFRTPAARVASLALPLLLVAGPRGAARGAGEPPAFEECEARARREPGRAGAWHCFREVAERTGAAGEAIRRLEAHLAAGPDRPWARLALANLLLRTGEPERARETAGRAAAAFAEAGDVEGEVIALVRLGYMEGRTGAFAEAEDRFARALSAAGAARREDLAGRVEIDRGYMALIMGDYSRANLDLGRAAARGDVLAPDSRLRLLGARAELALRTFEYGSSLTLYRKVVSAAREQRDAPMELAGLEGVMSVTQALARSGEASLGQVASAARQTLAAAERAGAADKICSSLVAVAEAVGGEEGRTLLRRAVATARATRDRRVVHFVLGAAGHLLSGGPPERTREARALLAEAREAAREHGGLWERRLAQEHVAMAARRMEPQERVVEEFARLFDLIERLRDLQKDEEVRARTFAEDAYAYRAFVGWLLGAGGGDSAPEEVDLAFRTMERMRARILLDTLDASGATAAVAPSGRHAERREAILDRIAAAQAALADPDLGGGARGSLLSELERLELEEAEIRQAMGREDPRYAALRQPALAGIEEARAALRADEALLAYQISAEEFGGSRLIVLTARDLAVHPLPEVAGLRREVRFFLGLLDARDGSERELASALGRDLVEPALDRLDATIRRLVLVPDDFLWRLPFDALRVGASGEPLGGRFETSIAPSATLLSRWRAGAPGPPRIPALSPADPVRPGEGSEAAASAAERQWALAEGLRLGRLPHARDEARGLVAALGRGSLLRLGVDASESFLKAARLREYGVVHLAAHALVDDARPARSAVLLAPGAPGEDGLLQAREIVGLDLSGRTVLLSACRSASGQVLSGEGPMSLAHAFFLAGARAVVGGLTPVRDDEAAAFVESLSRGIAAGEEVASALAAARLEKIRSGAPAAAWSSLVVLGDGALRPLPRALAAPSAPASATAVLIGLAALALGAALVSWLRRRLRAGVS